MILVVDASVALKWFLQSRDNEPDCNLALAILAGVDDDRIQLPAILIMTKNYPIPDFGERTIRLFGA